MEDNIVKGVVLLLGFAITTVLGIVGTFYPRAVQKRERIGPISLVPPFEFIRRYIQSPEWVVQARIAGVIALFIAAVTLYGLVELVRK